MRELELQLPTLQHKELAEEFKQEFFSYNENIINSSALFDQMDYNEWLINTLKNSKLETVRKDWVVATTYFAIRKSDNKIVGMIDIRHNLNNEFLANYGGHIGYCVRPTERKKGYATEMLKLGLNYAKSLDIKEVMLGCYANNIPSIKTIEKCGGILAETKPFADGKPVNVYWIHLQ